MKQLITDLRKLFTYHNLNRNRSYSKQDEPTQTTFKADIHQEKIMVRLWWDYNGMVKKTLKLYSTTKLTE